MHQWLQRYRHPNKQLVPAIKTLGEGYSQELLGLGMRVRFTVTSRMLFVRFGRLVAISMPRVSRANN
jgi:hypothetical protein